MTAPTASIARTSAVNRVIVTNDPNYLQTYKGLELTMNKRLSNRWQMLVGYTLAKTEINSIDLARRRRTRRRTC